MSHKAVAQRAPEAIQASRERLRVSIWHLRRNGPQEAPPRLAHDAIMNKTPATPIPSEVSNPMPPSELESFLIEANSMIADLAQREGVDPGPPVTTRAQAKTELARLWAFRTNKKAASTVSPPLTAHQVNMREAAEIIMDLENRAGVAHGPPVSNEGSAALRMSTLTALLAKRHADAKP